MLGLISKGIVIGVLVSAPMGPIGMLCIQRTLNKRTLAWVCYRIRGLLCQT